MDSKATQVIACCITPRPFSEDPRGTFLSASRNRNSCAFSEQLVGSYGVDALIKDRFLLCVG